MFKRQNDPSGLDNLIDYLQTDMLQVTTSDEEFAKGVDQLTKLYKLKEHDAPKRVSPDTLALIGGNLLGIVLILQYEKVSVVSSKALSFVMKLK